MSKEKIYSQIDTFVNTRVGKSKLYEIKFYVDTQTAEDRANFTQWIFKNDEVLKNREFNNIIDLCYGSGNLTSHILYESNMDTQNLILNDINVDDINSDIEIGVQTANDFLDAEQFDSKYDLIVFNPQIGGTDTYEKGAVEFKKTFEPIVFAGTFEKYLEEQGISNNDINVTINEDEKSIFIHSDTLSKASMTKFFKKIKIFNYYDVFYQSKESNREGEYTNIVKLRKTLDKISHNDSVVIFLGEDSIYETLFVDYGYVNIYMADEGKRLYILSKNGNKKVCYEYVENKFIINDNCKKENSNSDDDLEIGKYLNELDTLCLYEDKNSLVNCQAKEKKEVMKIEEKKETFDSTPLGKLEFPYKNILFKGVPGTGKSRAIDNIIDEKLKIKEKDKKTNTLRINIHSASSNADLMQGIGISTNGKDVVYKEKQGLIYDLIKRATFNPNQPFVLILEEIQENSLNELIGDLIYLIEDEKRARLKTLADDKAYAYQELIDMVVNKDETIKYVEIPFLVSSSTAYRKMILPDNLYIFCTSNYRDDKKVIEDNLLRRFEVIEIYPKKKVASEYSRDFFESLNKEILDEFKDEIHPDRYMVGHAIWKDVEDEKSFHRGFLKVVTEFKDIKEIEFETLSKVLKKVQLPSNIDEEIIQRKNYYDLIHLLQTKIGYDFIS